jgi:transcriptional regulator with XRE-family HTH domain
MSKQDYARIFQPRLGEAVSQTGLTLNAFCLKHGLDRPTVTQLLKAKDHRLPRGDTLAALATALNVSSDWLLGLTNSPLTGSALIMSIIGLSEAGDGPVEPHKIAWQEEAKGERLRYVPPTGIPEHLKTLAAHIYDHAPRIGTEEATRQAHDPRLVEQNKHRNHNYEVCLAVQKFQDFVDGRGLWIDMPPAMRRAQIHAMADDLDALYPNYRLYFYDERQHLTVSFDIFGSAKATVYVDGSYLVFSRPDHIAFFNAHFETLVRHAIVQPHEAAAFVRGHQTKIV